MLFVGPALVISLDPLESLDWVRAGLVVDDLVVDLAEQNQVVVGAEFGVGTEAGASASRLPRDFVGLVAHDGLSVPGRGVVDEATLADDAGVVGPRPEHLAVVVTDRHGGQCGLCGESLTRGWSGIAD